MEPRQDGGPELTAPSAADFFGYLACEAARGLGEVGCGRPDEVGRKWCGPLWLLGPVVSEPEHTPMRV
jgi:hypothetical protein